MITLERFNQLVSALRELGYGDAIEWTENLAPPRDADAFAIEVIHVIINSGMKASVAAIIVARVMAALHAGTPVASVYGHPGKAAAVETVWHDRQALFKAYLAADDKLGFCKALPWLGPVTQYHLAKNLAKTLLSPTSTWSGWRSSTA